MNLLRSSPRLRPRVPTPCSRALFTTAPTSTPSRGPSSLRLLPASNSLGGAGGLARPVRPSLVLGAQCGPVRFQSGGGGAGGGNDYQMGPGNNVQPQPSTQYQSGFDDFGREEEQKYDFKGTGFKMFEAAATTFASLAVLGLAGYAYHKYYKHITLLKIANAFDLGDPQLELANTFKIYGSEPDRWIDREEQARIDRIVGGEEVGKYYLLIGEKGTGKTSMLLSAMDKVGGMNCAMMEAHADSEIFRIRLGKCLDYEFHEDYIGSLFSIRGPRDTTAILDIERALNKLEKFALKKRLRAKKDGVRFKPLILMINSTHLIRHDDEGEDTIELLQQRAESWAASGLVTMILNSDEYWVYERLKPNLSRMEVIAIKDLPKPQAISALRIYRKRFHNETPTDAEVNHIYDRVGGRLAFLYRIAKTENMRRKAEEICQAEKTWFLNRCGILGSEMDDDVMDQQKFASAAMVLAKHLVEMEKADKEAHPENYGTLEGDHSLPQLPLYKARQVMTRADFIQEYDHDNLFTIDIYANVRADSVPMMNAFREIVNEEGFDEYLEATLERIGDIESLGRTRELTIKDLWYGGKYNFKVKNAKGYPEKEISLDVSMGDREAEKEREKEEERKEKEGLN